MSTRGCVDPVAVGDLIDYGLGELAGARQDALEEHLFACESCTRELERFVRLGTAVSAAVAEGRTATAVTGSLLTRAIERGARIRQYHLAPGDTVACTAGRDDTFVAIRLGGLPEGGTGLAVDLDFHDLDTGDGRRLHIEDVPPDAVSREVVLLLPGGTVRAYPRSRWTVHLRGPGGAEALRLGPYTLDHTPWEQLAGPD